MNMDNNRHRHQRFFSTRVASVLAGIVLILSITFALLPPGLSWNLNVAEVNYIDGSRAFQLQFGLLFLLAGIIAWNNSQWSQIHVRHLNPFLLLFIGLCFLSIIWSAYPFITFKRAIQQIGLVVIGIAISPPIGGKRQLTNTLLYVFTFLMLASIFIVLLKPDIGIDVPLGYAWRGVLPHKNALGTISALCAILWVRQIMERAIPLWLFVCGISLSLSLLIMSKSTTALLVFVMCTSIYLLIRKKHLVGSFDYTRLLLILASCVFIILLLFYIPNGHMPTWSQLFYPIEYFFNKSPTLTGRTDIWELLYLEIARHPLLGIGYGSFWLGQGGPSQYIADVLHWIPLQAHNGYLDIINELGGVGLCLFFGVLIIHARHLYRLSRIDREEAAIHTVIFLFIIISNFSESDFFRGLLFKNMLFIYSSVTISARLGMSKISSTDQAGSK